MQTTKFITLDCSRVPSKRSGLGQFATKVCELLESNDLIDTIIGNPDIIESKRHIISLPKWSQTKSKVSIFRALFWVIYTHFRPVINDKSPVFSVMQNVLPIPSNQVVTVHDLRPLHYPDNFLQWLYWKFVLPKKLQKTLGIVTVSESTKKLLISSFNLPSQKIKVVHNSYESTSTITEPYESRSNVLLSVGGNWAHKNIHEFLQNHKLWSSKFRFISVMAKTPYHSKIKKLIHDLGISSSVEILHDVTPTELEKLYRTSAALIYPSIEEGFGIPPLEAMSNGCPVILSDIPVFRELFKQAPIYVSLGDPHSWNSAFQLLDKPESVNKNIQLGRLVSMDFSKERMKFELNLAIKYFWPEFFQGIED